MNYSPALLGRMSCVVFTLKEVYSYYTWHPKISYKGPYQIYKASLI